MHETEPRDEDQSFIDAVRAKDLNAAIFAAVRALPDAIGIGLKQRMLATFKTPRLGSRFAEAAADPADDFGDGFSGRNSGHAHDGALDESPLADNIADELSQRRYSAGLAEGTRRLPPPSNRRLRPAASEPSRLVLPRRRASDAPPPGPRRLPRNLGSLTGNMAEGACTTSHGLRGHKPHLTCQVPGTPAAARAALVSISTSISQAVQELGPRALAAQVRSLGGDAHSRRHPPRTPS